MYSHIGDTTLVVLGALPDRTRAGCSVLGAAIKSAWDCWHAVFQRAREAVSESDKKTPDPALCSPRSAWNNRGSSPTFLGYILHSASWPLLFTCFVVAFYAESHAIAPGLRLLFPQQATTDFALFAGSDMATHAPAGIPAKLLQPFAELWLEDSFSVCLALLQAGLGMLILNQLEAVDTLAFGLGQLLKKRPICSCVFLIFDVALAVIAGNRGYESSGTGAWQIPASVAALLALAMPFASSYCLDLAVHSFAQAAAPLAAVLAACSIYFIQVAVPAIWVRSYGFAFIVLAGICATLWSVICGVSYMYLILAAVLSEFAQKVANLFRRDATGHLQPRAGWSPRTQDSFGD